MENQTKEGCEMTDKQFIKFLKGIRRYVRDVRDPEKIDAYLTEMIEEKEKELTPTTK